MARRKMLLLGTTALAALALAIPSSASATEILHEGNPMPAAGIHETLSLGSSVVQFANAAGGIACKAATATTVFTARSVHIESFTPSECETLGALNTVFGCQVEGNPVSTTPWRAPLTGTDLLIENVRIDNNMKAIPECFFGGQINVTGGNVTATPNNTASILSFSLSGNVTTTIGEAAVSGVMDVSNPGTFSIQ